MLFQYEQVSSLRHMLKEFFMKNVKITNSDQWKSKYGKQSNPKSKLVYR